MIQLEFGHFFLARLTFSWIGCRDFPKFQQEKLQRLFKQLAIC